MKRNSTNRREWLMAALSGIVGCCLNGSAANAGKSPHGKSTDGRVLSLRSTYRYTSEGNRVEAVYEYGIVEPPILTFDAEGRVISSVEVFRTLYSIREPH